MNEIIDNSYINVKSNQAKTFININELNKPRFQLNKLCKVSINQFRTYLCQYNISSALGNNTIDYFYGTNPITTITIPDGYYNLDTLLTLLNKSGYLPSYTTLELDANTMKYAFKSTSATVKNYLNIKCWKILGMAEGTTFIIQGTGAQQYFYCPYIGDISTDISTINIDVGFLNSTYND